MNNNEIVPTPRDVLNGRGMGVQRHPGNVKYRKLVFVNKGLYAKCPRADKIKISKGIVAAIRESGGRFLEHNERQDVYFDIGDKKATEKTSQALREGQKDIRKEIYKKEDEKAALTCSMGSVETVPYSNVTLPSELEVGNELPKEDYFQYSRLVLEALYNSDRNMPVPPMASPQALNQQPPPLPAPEPVQRNAFTPMYAAPPQAMPAQNHFNTSYFDPSSAAMAMALDQFPGVRMPIQAMPQTFQQQQPDRRAQFSLGAQSSSRTFRLTDMSLGSIYSIRQLVESTRHLGAQASDERGTMERGTMERGTMDSNLSSGTLQMIRQSELQLNQIDGMDFDDLTPIQGDIDALFDRNTMTDGDRFSDMRFSDLSKDRFTDFQDRGRSTDSSGSTKNSSYSAHSLMSERPSGGISTSDSDMAELLLRLSDPPFDNDGSSTQL